jgi:hypothetical protein
LPLAFFKKSLRGWQANYQAERDAQARVPDEASSQAKPPRGPNLFQ